MHILHLVPLVGTRSGGLGPVALNLVKEQQLLGHEAEIWCLDSSAEITEIGNTWNLEGTIVTSPTLGFSMVGYSPAAERKAISAVGGHYDILHQHSIWMANSRVTNRWRARFCRPTVVAPHGALAPYALQRSAWKKRFVSLCYEKTNLRQASCLHAVSDSEATIFREYGLKNPIAVIPNGLSGAWLHSVGDARRFRDRHSVPLHKRLLLFLSRIHPKKGLPILFEALSCIRHELADWYLVIAGPDEVGHRRELELLAKRLGITDAVQFVGSLWGSDKRDAFAAAELFVLPSHSEGSTLAVLEALGAGVPVLTTRGTPWQELQTYRCGWWVDVSVAAIRDALLAALCHPKQELAEMGQRGKILVATKYTWRSAAEKTIQLYEWLLGRERRPDFVVMD